MSDRPFHIVPDHEQVKVLHLATGKTLGIPVDIAPAVLSGALNYPLVVGVDPSMTSTGVASSTGRCQRIRTSGKKTDTHATTLLRIEEIADRIAVAVMADGVPDLVVMEAPSYNSFGSSTHQIAGLWWFAYARLRGMGLRTALAPPSNRMRYATGRGQFPKDLVMEAAKQRYPSFAEAIGKCNDLADAVIFMAMGRDHLGHPLAGVPQKNHEALAGVAWPEPSKGK